MDNSIFIQYNTPEERANAFRQMINAREEWRAHVREQKQKMQIA